MPGPVPAAAVRRKIEWWLSDPNDTWTAIALRARPEWTDDPVLTVNGVTARIVPCPTPLAALAALHERAEGERVVLLTELVDDELGDGLLAHVSKNTVRTVERWDVVRQLFGVREVDSTLLESRLGGGAWIADALAEHAPASGWPQPRGNRLTRDHALRCLSAHLLGIAGDQLDSAGLLQWTTSHPQRMLRFASLPAVLLDRNIGYLTEVGGPAVVPIMGAVRSGHGVDAIAVGLLVAAFRSADAGAESAVASARLEPYLGGVRLDEQQAEAFCVAAEAWVDRMVDADQLREVQKVLHRAEEVAEQIGAGHLLGGSNLLPSGFGARLEAFAAAIGPALKGDLAGLQRALERVEQHRTDNRTRVETARMAMRLVHWLATPDSEPATLLDALHRQVREDGWVDRARLDVFAGDHGVVREAYALLHRAVDERRARHDKQFATLLAVNTEAEAEPGTLLLVEDVLAKVVEPVLKRRQPVLLLVLDGMGMAAATELTESLTESGVWLELTPAGGGRTGVLAALPTITEVSRCSLFSGQIAVGRAPAERTAFAQRFPDGLLLHKNALRAGAGAALDPDVLEAVRNQDVPLVAAVVNTIDDALDRSDPGTVVWGDQNIRAVQDLLAEAKKRVVVLVSDHGHVVDRGPDGVVRPSLSSENRWRPGQPAAGAGEVAVRGSRVGKGDGHVVLPWREEIRYGPRKAGYHGGASPAEAVIPLIVLTAGKEDAVPGWSGAPVASPTWWREPVVAVPEMRTKRVSKSSPTQAPTLFEVPPTTSAPTSPVRPPLLDALLASDIYRRRRGTRAPLADDRVAALLTVLLGAGGRARLDTMAAQAEVPAHRIRGAVTALRKLLQVEGYPVLEFDPDGHTVVLDIPLLKEQFDVELP